MRPMQYRWSAFVENKETDINTHLAEWAAVGWELVAVTTTAVDAGREYGLIIRHNLFWKHEQTPIVESN